MNNESDRLRSSAAMLADGTVREIAAEAERLQELCTSVGITIDDSRAYELVRYLDMVLHKNEVLNLTAIRDWDKALVLHLVDSLTLLDEFCAQDAKTQLRPYLDMGCGAGFPGIPLALARPDRHGVLCDSVKKKVRAVDEFIEALGLSDRLETSSERLEVLGANHMRSFGCVVARAVAPLAVLIEYAAPLLAKKGWLVVSKGMPDVDEMNAGSKTAELCGLELLSQRMVELPCDRGQRTILTYAKVGEPTVKLPRAVGMATKVPLV